MMEAWILANRSNFVGDRRSNPPRQIIELQHRTEQRVMLDRV
jgi:hypothetical protein